MSAQTIGTATRRARKRYRCQICGSLIQVGDHHRVQTVAWDGRVYDWRDCAHCHRDSVVALVYAWAGCPDEGVDLDSSLDWASETVQYGSTVRGEYAAARNLMARVAGGEGE